MRSLPHKWPIILGAVVLLSAVLVLTYKPLLLSLGNFLIVVDEDLRPADLIHILGGSHDRLNYGASLYQQGYSPKLFITGGDDAVEYKRYVVAKGVHPDMIWPAESWATTTYEEALELKQFLAGEPSIRSVIIVSSPYHMRRARWTFEKVLGDQVRLQFAPVPVNASIYEQWWTDRRLGKSVVSEYFKLAFYYLKRFDF